MDGWNGYIFYCLLFLSSPIRFKTCCVVLWKEQSTIVLSHDNNIWCDGILCLYLNVKYDLNHWKKHFPLNTEQSKTYFMFCCVLFWWLMLLLITLIVITGLGQTPLLRSLMHAFFSLKNPISFLYGFSAYMCILHPLLLNSCVIICRAVQRFVTVSIRLDISEKKNNEKNEPFCLHFSLVWRKNYCL